MKIATLTMKNFRSYKDDTIPLDRVTIFRGLNASGKTSIDMAIEFALTGRCAVTDEAGRGGEDLIQQGSKETAVTMSFEGGGEIRRTRNHVGSNLIIAPRSGPPLAGKQAREWMADHGWDPDVLSAVLNSGRFLDLNPNEQRALLSRVLGAQPVDVPREMVEAMSLVGSVGHAQVLTSLEEVQGFYDAFYQMRTDLTRKLKALGESAAEPKLKGTTPDTARKKLRDLEAERERITEQRTKRIAAHSAGREKRRALEEKATELKPAILESKEEKRLLELVSHRDAYEQLKAQQTHFQGQAQEMARTIERVRDLGSSCPTCQRDLKPKDKEVVIKLLETGRAAAQSNVKRLGSLLIEYAGMEEAEQRLAQHRSAFVAVDRAERELAALAETDLPDTSDLDQALAKLATEIAAQQEFLVEARRFEDQHAQWESDRDRRRSLTAMLAACEKLVEFFGPNGIRTQMMAGKIPSFTEAMNRSLAQFGFRCRFSLDPYQFRVYQLHRSSRSAEACGVAAESGLDIRQLSESEAFRFAIAFQVALAEATGAKLVVIDRADLLDVQSRSNLLELLLASGLEQAIVMATAEAGLLVPPPEGVRVYWLERAEGGQTTHASLPQVASETAQAIVKGEHA